MRQSTPVNTNRESTEMHSSEFSDGFAGQNKARLPAENFEQHGNTLTPLHLLFKDSLETRKRPLVNSYEIAGIHRHRIDRCDAAGAALLQRDDHVVGNLGYFVAE